MGTARKLPRSQRKNAEFDRKNPIEAQLRGAWSPLALSLLSSLAAGHANQAVGELALMTSLGIGGLGLLFAAAGGGLVWLSYGTETGKKPEPEAVPEPKPEQE